MNAAGAFTRRDAGTALAAALLCFCTYSMVYAFRKPFTAGAYTAADTLWGVGYKSWLVISQVLGYMCSKIYGIAFIAGLRRMRRSRLVLMLVLASWLALLAFALTPRPWNILWLFANGFPLGLVWGVIFSFVEGRRATDFIGAALAVSFIFASGMVKAAAVALQQWLVVSDYWLPFVTGMVFLPPLALLLWLLEKIPPPNTADVQMRLPRAPMNRAQRRLAARRLFPGLAVLIIIYVFLTVFRDIRDNFMADMWAEAGYTGGSARFMQTEIPVTLCMLALAGAMMFIRNNFHAFRTGLLFVLLGFVVAGGASLLFAAGYMNVFYWLMLTGLGLYMGYIPFNCILFDRMTAAFGIAGNAGFFMYLADSFGYLGSAGVTIGKNLFSLQLQWTEFYSRGVIVLSALALLALPAAAYWFTRLYRRPQNAGVPLYTLQN